MSAVQSRTTLVLVVARTYLNSYVGTVICTALQARSVVFSSDEDDDAFTRFDRAKTTHAGRFRRSEKTTQKKAKKNILASAALRGEARAECVVYASTEHTMHGYHSGALGLRSSQQVEVGFSLCAIF